MLIASVSRHVHTTDNTAATHSTAIAAGACWVLPGSCRCSGGAAHTATALQPRLPQGLAQGYRTGRPINLNLGLVDKKGTRVPSERR